MKKCKNELTCERCSYFAKFEPREIAGVTVDSKCRSELQGEYDLVKPDSDMCDLGRELWEAKAERDTARAEADRLRAVIEGVRVWAKRGWPREWSQVYSDGYAQAQVEVFDRLDANPPEVWRLEFGTDMGENPGLYDEDGDHLYNMINIGDEILAIKLSKEEK